MFLLALRSVINMLLHITEHEWGVAAPRGMWHHRSPTRQRCPGAHHTACNNLIMLYITEYEWGVAAPRGLWHHRSPARQRCPGAYHTACNIVKIFTMVAYFLRWTLLKYFSSIPDEQSQQKVWQLGRITRAVINTSNEVKCSLLWEFLIHNYSRRIFERVFCCLSL